MIVSPKMINKAVAALKGKNIVPENVSKKQKSPKTNHEDSSIMMGQSLDLISSA